MNDEIENYLKSKRLKDEIDLNVIKPKCIWFITKKHGNGDGPFIVGGTAYDHYDVAFHVWTTLREECDNHKYDLIELNLLTGNVL
jgi:hypothetical protein